MHQAVMRCAGSTDQGGMRYAKWVARTVLVPHTLMGLDEMKLMVQSMHSPEHATVGASDVMQSMLHMLMCRSTNLMMRIVWRCSLWASVARC